MRTALGGIVVLVVALAGAADAQPRPRTVSYGSHAQQALDVYPLARAPVGGAPVLVYVHGGGWSKGDKSRVGQKVTWCARRGWVLVSVNYRLLPAGKHPANVVDVARAIAWVHDRIGRFGGDPGSIFAIGHSAGAHLVTLAATDRRRLAAFGKPLSILRGAIELDTGALDLPAIMARGGGMHRTVFGEDPAVWRDASPVTHVAKGRSIPPFLLIHADRGKAMKEAQTRAFAAALRAAEVPVEVYHSADDTHASLNRRLGEKGHAPTERVRRFVERRLAALREAGRTRRSVEQALDEALGDR